MSGGSAFGSLWADIEVSIGSTESLIKRLRALQMTKPPSRPEELAAIVTAYNRSHEALSTELKGLKKLIEEYRDEQFTGTFPGEGGPLSFSVTAGIPSRIDLFEPPDPFDYQGDGLAYLVAFVLAYVGHKFQNSEIARKHIEGRVLPKIINDRRNQDNVALNLRAGTEALVQLYDEDPKVVGELLGEVLKKLIEFLGDEARNVFRSAGDLAQDAWKRITELIDWLLDLLSLILGGIAHGADVAWDAIVSVLAPIGPIMGTFMEAHAGDVTVFVGAVLVLVANVLASRGFKIDANGDLEKNNST